jgi:hypothetical protein
MLIRGMLTLVLTPTRVVVSGASLLFTLLGATGDEVVRVTIVEAPILRPATPLIRAVVVKPCEPTGYKHQLLIPKALHMLLYYRQQGRQSKHSR